MAPFPVIDADGHLIEQMDLLRSYLKAPFDKRSGPLFHSEPWDAHLQGTLPANRDWLRRDLKAGDVVVVYVYEPDLDQRALRTIRILAQ